MDKQKQTVHFFLQIIYLHFLTQDRPVGMFNKQRWVESVLK